MKKSIAIAVMALFGVALFAGACASKSVSLKSPADGVTATTRQLVVTDEPSEAPGEQLGLSRVILPAGAKLQPHTHPGPQLSLITEGTLTYTVYTGEATVYRNAAGPDPKTETIKAGETVDIHIGDSLLEPEGIVHKGVNNGKTPVVLYSTSLFKDGAPASSPATVPTG
jgi:quercetin dioxygenase-like cupin family protein